METQYDTEIAETPLLGEIAMHPRGRYLLAIRNPGDIRREAYWYGAEPRKYMSYVQGLEALAIEILCTRARNIRDAVTPFFVRDEESCDYIDKLADSVFPEDVTYLKRESLTPAAKAIANRYFAERVKYYEDHAETTDASKLPIDLSAVSHDLENLVRGVVWMNIGYQPYDNEYIQTAVQRAQTYAFGQGYASKEESRAKGVKEWLTGLEEMHKEMKKFD